MAGKRQYCCADRFCDGKRMLPWESPETVRAGCPQCEEIVTMLRWNSVAMANRLGVMG